MIADAEFLDLGKGETGVVPSRWSVPKPLKSSWNKTAAVAVLVTSERARALPASNERERGMELEVFIVFLNGGVFFLGVGFKSTLREPTEIRA